MIKTPHKIIFIGMVCLAAAFSSCVRHDPVRMAHLLGGPLDDGAYSIRQTSDGGYIIAGSMEQEGAERELAIFKLTPGFLPDEKFAAGGRFLAGSSRDDQAIDVIEVVEEDGSSLGYLAVGYVSAGDGDFAGETYHGKIDLALIRLDSAGRPDSSFAENGLMVLGGSGDDEVIVHLDNYSEPGDRIVQDGQAFIIAAMTRSSDGDLDGISCLGVESSRDILLFKIDGSGRTVPSFGDNGFLRIGCAPGRQKKQQSGSDFLFSIEAVGAEGFIGLGYTVGKEIVVGERIIRSRGNNDEQGLNEGCESGPCYKMDGFTLRIHTDGTLVDRWGDHGLRFIGGTRQEKMYDVVRMRDGRFLMTGRTSSVDLDMAANPGSGDAFDAFGARLTAEGRLDSTFAAGGMLIFPGTGSDRAHRVCELEDGRIAILVVSDSNDDLFAPFSGDDSKDELYICIADRDGDIEQIVPLGGSGNDKPVGMILNREGRLVITGCTESGDGVFSGSRLNGGKDVFVIEYDWKTGTGSIVK